MCAETPARCFAGVGRPCSPTGSLAGKYRAPGRPGCGSRTISALWTTQQAHPIGERRWQQARLSCRRTRSARTLPVCPRAERAHFTSGVGAPAPGSILYVARALEEAMREENVPTEQPQAKQEARLPPADAVEGRSGGAPPSPDQGPLPPVGLIWPVRERSSFRALATWPAPTSRGRHGDLRSGRVTGRSLRASPTPSAAGPGARWTRTASAGACAPRHGRTVTNSNRAAPTW